MTEPPKEKPAVEPEPETEEPESLYPDAWVEEQKKLGKHIEKRGPYVAVTEKMYAGSIELDKAIERQIELVQLARIWSGYDGFTSAVLMLVDMIPVDARDEQFQSDMKAAYQYMKVQNGNYHYEWSPGYFGHKTRAEEVKPVFDPTAAFRAVINMLHRRGKFWRETQRATLW